MKGINPYWACTCRIKDDGDIKHLPLGPRVTATASAILLMPICILALETLSKMISLEFSLA